MAGADRRGLPTWLLFWGPTLIWASTWHVILYQLASPVPVFDSLAWRFGLAALALLALARWQGHSLRMPMTAHALALATGVVQYSGNYWAVYEAERHIPSGLVAVLFCLMVFINALTGRLFFDQRVTRRFLLASVGAVAGVAMIFWPEITAAGAARSATLGFGLSMAAVLAACAGNVMTLTLTRRGLALLPVLAWGMAYGALALLGLALATGDGRLHFDTSLSYVASLAYLTVFGSVAAFVLYFKLAQRKGAAGAALTSVVIPVIALLISAVFEGWQPTLLSTLGMALCLTSIFVATRPTAAAA